MGNYVSCTLSTSTVTGQTSSAKVILPNGEIRRLDGPTKAAELMLEAPNYFLTDSRSLRVGGRLSPLGADDDLEIAAGAVYVMFPMKRVNAIVSAADMGFAFFAAEKTKNKNKNMNIMKKKNKRVLPEEEDGVLPEKKAVVVLDLEGEVLMHRLSMSKSKKPLLETIVEDHEEPVCLFR